MQNTREMGLIPWLGRSPGIGNVKPLQNSWWQIMDRGAWQATVHGVAKSWIQLSTEAQHTGHEK